VDARPGPFAVAPERTLPAGSPVGLPAPNGSRLVLPADIDARRAPGRKYAPLQLFDGRYLRWERGRLALVSGSREFSAREASLFAEAVAEVNAAIGRPVFATSAPAPDAVPVSAEAEGAPGVQAYVEFTLRNAVERGGYLEARIALNVGMLRASAPDGPAYESLFKVVALHELGHIAGLDHDPEIGTLMHIGRDPAATTFSRAELDALRLLYGT